MLDEAVECVEESLKGRMLKEKRRFERDERLVVLYKK